MRQVRKLYAEAEARHYVPMDPRMLITIFSDYV